MMIGKIIKITSDIIEIQFKSSDLPSIGMLLKTNSNAILSVEVINSDTSVSAIIISSTSFVEVGQDVISTKKGIMAPVGKEVLGRIFNVLGEAIDGKPISTKQKYEEVKINKVFEKEFNKKSVFLETGIKAIDFFIPIFEGNKVGTFGGAGVGKTLVIKEIINNISKTSQKSNSLFVGIGERSREGEELYRELIESKLINKVGLYFAQMNETPGARMKLIYTAITTAEYFRDVMKEDTYMFIDNIYRYTQAGSEVSSSLGKIPSQSGYQPTLFSEISNIQERMSNNSNGNITSFQTVFVPADDITDPATVAIFSHLDASLVLEREMASSGKYPAIDPLASSSNNINESTIGKRHYDAVIKTKNHLQRFVELEDLLSVLGSEGLTEEDNIIIKRARMLSNFFTQNFNTAEDFTQKKGQFIKLEDTIKSVETILNGELDSLNPVDFLYIGTTEKLVKKVQDALEQEKLENQNLSNKTKKYNKKRKK
ncbi:MAG: F0F1 ATP synthase subunit beta [Mycoplasma sp.]|nr:F0F1 ATP synthase subunit beta [Mycoplasma sp.]